MLKVGHMGLIGYSYSLNEVSHLKGGLFDLGGNMTSGEIISIIAVCISFLGVLSSFIFSYRKADREREKERELNVQNITIIKKEISNIGDDVNDIKAKLNKLSDKRDNDHDIIIKHEARITSLEKEVFKKGA